MRSTNWGRIGVGLLLVTSGCGSQSNQLSPPIILNRDAIYVANEGSSSVSAFQGAALVEPAGPVVGSPFHMTSPPSGLGGGGLSTFGLVVLSGSAHTISLYSVDYKTSVLSGPLTTVTTTLTPTAVVAWRDFFYVADAEGSVSAYHVASGGAITEVEGSPFPVGAGPVAVAAAEPGLLYVANSVSNDVSGFLINVTTGGLTPLPGSPYPAGTSPAWVDVEPPFYPNPLGGPTLAFVANSGSNNISVYSISASGALGTIPGSPFAAGAGPSSIGIGNAVPLKYVYVANSRSADISGFNIDPNTGVMTPLPGSPFPAGLNPCSVAVSIGRKFLYAANAGSNSMSVFQIDGTTGWLTQVSRSPFPVGQSPRAVLYYQVPQ